MRRPSSPNLLPPAMLLALSVTLCGGSLLQAGVPAAVLQGHLADRATELTATQRETVAQFLQCLTEAAKELRKHNGKAVTGPLPSVAQVAARAELDMPAPPAAPPMARQVALHHLNLPPPGTPR